MNLDQALQYARDINLTDDQIAVAVRAVADDARFKRDSETVALTHPVTSAEIRVHPDTVEQQQKAGWVRKESLESTTDEAPEETPAGRKPRKATT